MGRRLCEVCQRFYETDDFNSRFCNLCKGTYETQRKKCLEYIAGHKNASIIEISMSTSIPIKDIKKLIDDGVIDWG